VGEQDALGLHSILSEFRSQPFASIHPSPSNMAADTNSGEISCQVVKNLLLLKTPESATRAVRTSAKADEMRR
jgi:hypothetical protein